MHFFDLQWKNPGSESVGTLGSMRSCLGDMALTKMSRNDRLRRYVMSGGSGNISCNDCDSCRREKCLRTMFGVLAVAGLYVTVRWGRLMFWGS